MKLSAILEAEGNNAASDVGIRQPRNAEEAEALFRLGLREMEVRNDEAAFRIFGVLSHYMGGRPAATRGYCKSGPGLPGPPEDRRTEGEGPIPLLHSHTGPRLP